MSRARADHLSAHYVSLLVLLLPLALLHARAGAEILIGLIDWLFLLHCWAARDWGWRRQPFAVAAALWWGWMVLCSAVGTGGFVLALVSFRLPLLALALGQWALRKPGIRHALWWLLAACCGWIALECWQQYLTGTNMFGQGRWVDGALTGPFNKPRAGPEFILLFFPVLVPAVSKLLSRGVFTACVLGVFGVCTMILIGQRMPNVLMVLGLALTAATLPRLRFAVLGVVLTGVAVLAATPVVSPPTYDKLVLHFADQMQHFQDSTYGRIYGRALHLAADHPVLGRGFDAFRRNCPAALGEACNIHPHNYYLEAADNGGLPLLAAFCLMAVAALWRLGVPLRQRHNALLTGLFVGGVVAFWPIASTSAFTAIPNAGWIFLCLGLGFAVAGENAALEFRPGG
jgi:hypothetical protein